jgi:hypothetical protein
VCHELTKEQIAYFVSSLGENFSQYQVAIIKNCIDGTLLSSIDEAELVDIYSELGINSKLHQKIR